MQSPSPISYDRTTSNVSERYPAAAEPSELRAPSLAPSEETGLALEGRLPIADPSEGLPVDPRLPLKGPGSGRPGRMARFARKTPKTAATLPIPLLPAPAPLHI